MKTIVVLLAVALTGCVTTLDPNYALQVQAYSDTVRAQQAVEMAKANAEAARFDAMAAIAQNSNEGTRSMAIMALALAHGNGGASGNVNVVLPQAPERQEDRAYKWAALFAAPVATLVQGYFGYRTATNASNNNRDTSIASYNAFGTMATAGFNSNVGIATAGFRAIGGMRPPAPNVITLSGNGVIGGGSFVGPNSGTNSGNTGRINSDDNSQRPCTITPSPTGVLTPC